ncbi:MAG: tetratricopeptide repeat protein [Candidatus Zixiibacteriota bacterium]
MENSAMKSWFVTRFASKGKSRTWLLCTLMITALTFSLSNSCSSQNPDFEELVAKIDKLIEERMYAEALAPTDQAFTIALRDNGWKSISTLKVAHSLGLILSEVGPFDRAESFLMTTAGYDSLVFGPRSTAVALTFFNLAGVYDKQEKFRQAIDYYERVINIRRGSEHPTLAMSYRSLAGIYADLEQPRKGMEYANHAFRVESKLLSEMSPDRTINLMNAAEASIQLGDFVAADTLLQYAARIGEAYWGRNSNFFVHWNSVVGRKYFVTGHFDSAAAYFYSARGLIKSLDVDAPLSTAKVFAGIAETELRLGNPEIALAYCDSAVVIPQSKPVSAGAIRGRIEAVRAGVGENR